MKFKTFVPLTSVALLIGLSACGHKADQTADAASNSAANAMDDTSNMASNAMMATTEAVTPTPTGQVFTDTAAKSDAFEIAAAKLAETNASSADVKSFAKEMISAHTKSTEKIKKAAEDASPAITPDPTLTSNQAKELADLGNLQGADFDKSYVSGQVDAHKSALELMQNYAKDGSVASLKAAAADIAPIVQKHLDMARALDK